MSTNVFSGRSAIKQIPSQAELKALFDYRDGHLYWKVRPSYKFNIGDRAGSVEKQGYLTIKINGVIWKAHRLAYQWYHGDLEQSDIIDHWDGNKLNNKISNLRPCDNRSNTLRSKTKKNNTSGVPGVYWHKPNCKWSGEYRDKTTGKSKYIGYYTNKYHAYHVAREAMVREYGVDYKEPVLTLENRQAYMDWLIDSQPDPAYDWMTA